MEFILRPWTALDLGNLVRYADNAKIAANMTNKFIHPYTIEQGKNFIDFASQTTPCRIFAIAVGEEAIGAAGIHPQADIFCKNAELAYWIGEPFWGKGIATKVVTEMVEYGFKTWDLDRIFARPFGTNIASQRVLEKAGFTLEGKFENTIFKNGNYTDELVYAIRKK